MLNYDELDQENMKATVVVAVAAVTKAVAPTLPDPVAQLLLAVGKGPSAELTDEDEHLTDAFYQWCATMPCADVHDALGSLHVLGMALRRLFLQLESYGLTAHLMAHLTPPDDDITSGPAASPGSN